LIQYASLCLKIRLNFIGTDLSNDNVNKLHRHGAFCRGRMKYVVIALKLCLDLGLPSLDYQALIASRDLICDCVLIASFMGEFDDAIRFDCYN
jgi:hypothetical protein